EPARAPNELPPGHDPRTDNPEHLSTNSPEHRDQNIAVSSEVAVDVIFEATKTLCELPRDKLHRFSFKRSICGLSQPRMHGLLLPESCLTLALHHPITARTVVDKPLGYSLSNLAQTCTQVHLRPAVREQ